MTSDRPLQQWTEPVVGLLQDHTFFDGVYIRTDSICNPSRDRVLPIMAEEQVFTCRQMKARLEDLREEWRREGKTGQVLDVGTGSGVLAIYADKVLNRDGEVCAAIRGMDVSVRALQRAQANVEANQCRGVTIDNVEKAGRYTAGTAENGSLDLVLLNPPFNPTAPTFDNLVAHHGATKPKDEVSLSCFKEWLPVVKEHLRQGGWIIGCQLSPIDAQGKVLAVEFLRQMLGPRSQIRYCHTMPGGKVVTKKFLEGQYKDHLPTPREPDAALEKADGPKEMRGKTLWKWIDDKADETPYLTIIYYEARLQEEQGEEPEDFTPPSHQQAHRVTWEQRVAWHRMVVNNTQSYPEELPLQSLASVLPVRYHTPPEYERLGEYWKARGAGVDEKELLQKKSDLAATSILSDLNRYLRDSQVFEKFDFVVVDATPILPNTRQGSRLHQECRLWWNPRNADVAPERWKELLCDFQWTIYRMQQSRLAPFFHPWFIYPHGETGWSRGWVSRMRGKLPVRSAIQPHDPNWDRIQEYINKIRIFPVPPVDRTQEDLFLIHEDSDRHYVHSSAQMAELTQKQSGRGVSGTPQVGVDWQDYLRPFRERLRAFTGDSPLSAEGDHRNCHWAMHSMHQQGALDLGPEAFSILMGVPLCYASQLSPPLEALDEKSSLPQPYYGGVWFWAGNIEGEPEVSYDTALKDFVRFTLHLLERAYKELLVEANEQLGDDKRQYRFAHQNYQMISSIWEALRYQLAFDDLNPATWAALLALKMKMGIYRGDTYSLERLFPLPKQADPIDTYSAVAGGFALQRACSSRADVAVQVAAGEMRLKHGREAPRHCRDLVWKRPQIQEECSTWIDKEAFAVLLIAALGQAMYHAYCYAIKAGTEFTEDERLEIRIDANPHNLKVIILNPGEFSNVMKQSEDLIELRELAEHLENSESFGPTWDKGKRRWVTSFQMTRTGHP